jgi:hypothetical protein
MIPVMSESGQLARGNIRQHRIVTKGLPLVDVGQMNFHNGAGQQKKGIPKGHRGMGQGTGIDDNAPGIFFKNLMDTIQYHPFMVGLKEKKFPDPDPRLQGQAAG